MATLNNFTELYKTISHTELLNILDNPNDYQPLAVEAAKVEFVNRQLSEDEIQKARLPLIAKQEQKEKKKEKAKEVETKIKAAGYSFIDTFNPIESGITVTERTIRFIIIVFGGIFMYQFIKDFNNYLPYINDIPKFPFESITYLLPQILLATAIITFWRRKTFGWLLLAIFLTFSIVGVIGILFRSFNWKPSGFGNLDNLFPRPSPVTYIIQLLFFGGTLYSLCKKNIREVFSISRQTMWATISITTLATILLLFVIF